jgi:hypothetical protein
VSVRIEAVRAIAIVACVASSAAADRLVMKESESDNIHLANHEGAINRRADIAVLVDLLAGGKARVYASGERSEHNLYPTYSTDDTTSWKTQWAGTWTKSADSLQLELAVASDNCTHTKKASDQPGETLACSVPAKTVRVTCKSDTVTVEDFAHNTKTQVAAWTCASSGELGATPATWTFGKSTCVMRTTGMGGIHYTKCP